MSTPTYAQMLDDAKKALAAATAGKSFTKDGVTFTRQDLPTLQQQVRWLEEQVAREAASVQVGSGTGFVQVEI